MPRTVPIPYSPGRWLAWRRARGESWDSSRWAETSGGSAHAPPSRPAEAFDRAGGGAVFAADPAVITQLVEQIEEIGVVDLAAVGLVAVGHAGDLDMGVAPGEAAQMDGEITLHDLAVIEVELQFDVVAADAVEDGERLGGGVEEIAGDIARIDRLDQQGDAVRRDEVGGAAQIGDEHGSAFGFGAIGGPQAGEDVEPLAAGRQRIAQRTFGAGSEIRLAAGQRAA